MSDASQDRLKRGLLASLPEGALRQLVPEGDEDLLMEGIAESLADVLDTLLNTKYIRNPYETDRLEDLEREYGFLLKADLSVTDRQNRIAALKYAKRGSATAEALQAALHLAGFTQLVVVECRQDQDPRTVAAGEDFEYVVNGIESQAAIGYDVACDSGLEITCTGDLEFTCEDLSQISVPVNYDASDYWNKTFFVAETVTVDGDGYVTAFASAQIARYYRNIIHEIILRLKPNDTWGILGVEWADPVGYGFGFFPMGISAHGR